jgi:hypothetical protein
MQSVSTLLFTLCIFLAAALGSIVQPLVGKILLPLCGGSASVWSTCLLFFQIGLLVGYGYAAFMQKFSLRIQISCHALATVATLLFLPISIGDLVSFQQGTPPVITVLLNLVILCGVPYVLLSATSPLFQSWSAQYSNGKSPYWLYSVSNAASLLGLLSYPFLFEPNYALPEQSIVWSRVCFGFICAALILIALLAGRVTPAQVTTANAADHPARTHPWMMWLLYSFTGSLLLMGVTNVICRDIAAIPLLWIIPLSIFLLTFSASFTWRFNSSTLLACLLLSIILTMTHERVGLSGSVWFLVSAFSAYAFAALICSSELANCKPPPEDSTRFYLCIALGGALGGAFVSLLAPVIFVDYSEFAFGMIIFCLLNVARIARFSKRGPVLKQITFGAVTLLVSFILTTFLSMLSSSANVIFKDRSFYGTLRVTCDHCNDPQREQYSFTHGNTVHGVQHRREAARHIPTAYFAEGSGIQRALSFYSTSTPVRIGVVGLGIGTVAAYGRTGDLYKFYELDPAVTAVARKYFTFLSDSKATVEVVHGDGRLLLEDELNRKQQQNFDLLMLDAFSSDSVPVHLLTTEALQLYQQHLSSSGIMIFNISNRYLDLESLLAAEALALGLESVTLLHFDEGAAVSRYVALFKKGLPIGASLMAQGGIVSKLSEAVHPWTDNSSNILSILRR